MSYLGYVVAAYAVFVGVLAWDFLSPRLQVRQALRRERTRASRAPSQARRDAGDAASKELIR
jgi:heme exporter protein D